MYKEIYEEVRESMSLVEQIEDLHTLYKCISNLHFRLLAIREIDSKIFKFLDKIDPNLKKYILEDILNYSVNEEDLFHDHNDINIDYKEYFENKLKNSYGNNEK